MAPEDYTWKKRKTFAILTPIWQSFYFFDDGNRLNKDEILFQVCFSDVDKDKLLR